MFSIKIIVLSCIYLVYASRKHDRIIGGNKAPENKYPFMASLRIRGKHFCAGSLINRQWILTATHCFLRVGLDDDITAVLGSNQLYNSRFAQEFKVVNIIKHNQFNLDRGYNNDIALLKLDKAVSTNNRVQAIQISTDRLTTNFTVMIVGWGNTEPSTAKVTTSNDLKELIQVAQDLQTCSKTYTHLYNTQLCIWSPNKDTGGCIGDSGGPLVTTKGTQVGILSHGSDPCAQNIPTIYTDVSQYIEWIKNNLRNEL